MIRRITRGYPKFIDRAVVVRSCLNSKVIAQTCTSNFLPALGSMKFIDFI